MNEKDLDMRMWQDRYDIYLSDIRAQKRHAAETGRKEGLKEGIIETAKKMLLNGLSPELITKCTNLPLSSVMEIKNNLVNS